MAPQRPLDDWCRAALIYRGIGLRIRKIQKAQGDGSIPPEVQERIDAWLNKAEEVQRAYGEESPSA